MEMERMNLEPARKRAEPSNAEPSSEGTGPQAAAAGNSNGPGHGPQYESGFTPREIALDTLHTLRLYIDRVVHQCDRVADETDPVLREELFQQLLDSLAVINEGLALSRRILRPGIHATLDLLETDLLSILKDLCLAAEANQADHRMELVAIHLVKNLNEWRESGIPLIVEAAGSEV